MSTTNTSTGLSPFLLCLGYSPQIIPTVLAAPEGGLVGELDATGWLRARAEMVEDAKDSLMHTKIVQAANANGRRDPEPAFPMGSRVMLSMKHQRHNFRT
jgi:hypothetical protein